MAQMAHALDRTQKNSTTATTRKNQSAFIKAYVHDDGSVTSSASSLASIPAPGDPSGKILKESQTGYVLAIHMNLLPEHCAPKLPSTCSSCLRPITGV
jgi:hypothetical protein